jgi:hypothetical protein
MNTDSPSLHIGIADFAKPTLLIVGDASSLLWLATSIQERRTGRLADLSSSIKLKNVDLRLSHANDEGRLERRSGVLDWTISPLEARKFADQLRALATSEGPGHAYLDTSANDSGIQIVASKGEYDPDTVFV